MGSVVLPQDQLGDAAPSLQQEGSPQFWGPSEAPVPVPPSVATAIPVPLAPPIPTPPVPMPPSMPEATVTDISKPEPSLSSITPALDAEPAISLPDMDEEPDIIAEQPKLPNNNSIVINFGGSDMPAVVPTAEKEEVTAPEATPEPVSTTMNEKKNDWAEKEKAFEPDKPAEMPKPYIPSSTWTVPEPKEEMPMPAATTDGLTLERIAMLDKEAAVKINTHKADIDKHEADIAELKTDIAGHRASIAKLEEQQMQLGKDKAALELLERNRKDLQQQEDNLKESLKKVEAAVGA